MKATDLMIGDLVMIKDYPMKAMPKKMSPEYYTRSLIEIEPIPLTPEILEKNGFKYSEWYGWQIKEPDFTLCFVGDTPHFLLDDIFVCDCPYVHTLQHALKLCGIEKEIVI